MIDFTKWVRGDLFAKPPAYGEGHIRLIGDEKNGFFWVMLQDFYVCPKCKMRYLLNEFPNLKEGYRCQQFYFKQERTRMVGRKNELAEGTDVPDKVQCYGRIVMNGSPVELGQLGFHRDYMRGLNWAKDGKNEKRPLGRAAWEKWFTQKGAAERGKLLDAKWAPPEEEEF
ncbi:hypothetical protein CMI37_11245 [Candidatus Pacearchaeota archaeon]|nr:hypothetical protein [Candidatus Pacearchaeota archaeon]|tara:strand:- start:54 stop:563 length:510 start_codon:yes stop_codon:yes gene_type:complete